MRYPICDIRHAICGRQGDMASTIYMATAPVVGSSFELFSFRAISLFSLPPTPIYSYSFIFTPGHVAQTWEFSSAGGPFLDYLHVQKGLSCPSVGYAQSSIYISTCACVVLCMASLFASTKHPPGTQICTTFDGLYLRVLETPKPHPRQ